MYICIYMYVSMYVCIYIYVCVCVCVCVCIGDKAFWRKLGYKGRNLQKKLPHCELFHDCE